MCLPPDLSISVSPTFVFVWSLHLFVAHFVCTDTHAVLTAIYSVALGALNVLHSCVSAVHKLEHPTVSEGTKVSVSLLCCTTKICPAPDFTISVSPTLF